MTSEKQQKYSILVGLLYRHLLKYKKADNFDYQYSGNYGVKQFFSNEEELSLVTCIKNVAKKQYGLTKKGVRTLAFKFAKANKKKDPDTRNDEEIAVEDWIFKNACRRTVCAQA